MIKFIIIDYLYLGSSNSSGKLLSVVMSASQVSAEDREYLITGNLLIRSIIRHMVTWEILNIN